MVCITKRFLSFFKLVEKIYLWWTLSENASASRQTYYEVGLNKLYMLLASGTNGKWVLDQILFPWLEGDS